MGWDFFNCIRLLRALSDLALSVAWHVVSTTYLGQCFTTLIVNNSFYTNLTDPLLGKIITSCPITRDFEVSFCLSYKLSLSTERLQ